MVFVLDFLNLNYHCIYFHLWIRFKKDNILRIWYFFSFQRSQRIDVIMKQKNTLKQIRSMRIATGKKFSFVEIALSSSFWHSWEIGKVQLQATKSLVNCLYINTVSSVFSKAILPRFYQAESQETRFYSFLSQKVTKLRILTLSGSKGNYSQLGHPLQFLP